MMVTEQARISVPPGQEKDFEADVARAVPLFAQAAGCHGMRLERAIETGEFYLLVQWDSVAHHEAFRASPAFADWRALAGPHFAAPPQVVHLECRVAGFG